jgi:hypothetical protein
VAGSIGDVALELFFGDEPTTPDDRPQLAILYQGVVGGGTDPDALGGRRDGPDLPERRRRRRSGWLPVLSAILMMVAASTQLSPDVERSWPRMSRSASSRESASARMSSVRSWVIHA